MIVKGEASDIRDMAIAKDVGETLHKHYPGHLWAVAIDGGVILIKNLAISHTHGMVLHLTSYYADPSNKRVIQLGGELLERAHLARGRDTGEDAQILEGVGAQYQPINGVVR